jgi:hypothetical protein
MRPTSDDTAPYQIIGGAWNTATTGAILEPIDYSVVWPKQLYS